MRPVFKTGYPSVTTLNPFSTPPPTDHHHHRSPLRSPPVHHTPTSPSSFTTVAAKLRTQRRFCIQKIRSLGSKNCTQV
uniref:Uncharacterized protein n=1 Tax=Gossypium raimondii TaxID=29730 RepID=A0A0D2U3A8_GOSRA|nr:hypothetical protein B456_009G417000 [Gossypium raimondii]KJB62441.1 hypothetical protein B456_009G417000 [Gossypium raimondii]